MALVKCKDCGNMISYKATQCPKCGAPKKKKSGCSGLLLIAITALFVIPVMAGIVFGRASGESAHEDTQKNSPPELKEDMTIKSELNSAEKTRNAAAIARSNFRREMEKEKAELFASKPTDKQADDYRKKTVSYNQKLTAFKEKYKSILADDVQKEKERENLKNFIEKHGNAPMRNENEILDFLKSTAKDPSSVVIYKLGYVAQGTNGWIISVEHGGKNSFNAMVRERCRLLYNDGIIVGKE